MIQGSVSPDGEASVRLKVRGPVREEEIEAVIDTGFSSFLSLSPDLVSRLGLTFNHQTKALLANGEVETFDVYRAAVLWEGHFRPIMVLSSEGGSLVGMLLLRGSRLTIDVIDGGKAIIQPLPDPLP